MNDEYNTRAIPAVLFGQKQEIIYENIRNKRDQVRE